MKKSIPPIRQFDKREELQKAIDKQNDVEITEADILKEWVQWDGIYGIQLKILAPTLADYLRRLFSDGLLPPSQEKWKAGNES